MAEIESILFPTDFSDYSNRAFGYAASLAEAFGARLIMMHIEEFLESDPANPEHSFAALEQFKGVLETERIVLRGHAPYKHILDLSRDKNCDLIVMATHGRNVLSQFFLGGSVAEEVARFSTTPVFVVKVDPSDAPEKYIGRLKEILFPTDLSEASARAFPHAVQFAQKFETKLFAMHVIDDESLAFYKSKGIDRDAPDVKERVERLLRDFITSLPGGDSVTSFHIADGRAETEIERFAEQQGADLIVLATHGHSGLQEDVMGSTTERIIRRAHCPVLAVRG
jgi:nucleotide-binding universal stress UspA family protein